MTVLNNVISDATGSVGLGTTSPQARLFVSGSSVATWPVAVVRQGSSLQQGGVGVLDVQNNLGTSLLFVSGSGRVGIGVTPDATVSNAKLEVNGSVIPTSHLASSNNIGEPARYWGNVYSNFLHVYNGSLNSVSATGNTFQVYSQTSPAAYSIYADSNNRVGIGAVANSTVRLIVSGTTTGSDTTLRVRHGILNGSSLPVLDVQDSSGTSLLFVSGSGRVGIGTTSPGYSLHVAGSTSGFINPATPADLTPTHQLYIGGVYKPAYIKASPRDWYGNNYYLDIATQASSTSLKTYIRFLTEDLERVRIDGSGNVGIGTTNPGYAASNRQVLYLNATTSNVVGFGIGGTNVGYLFSDNTNLELYAEGTREARVTTGGAGPVILSTASSERVRVDSSGNVGIGTTNTNGNRLAVSGDMSITGSILPFGDAARDLGSSTYRWRTLFAANISGSLTPTGATAGSVFFAGGSGQINQDNANFFWDDTNNRLGIGTNTGIEGILTLRGGNSQRLIIQNSGIQDNQDYGAVAWKNAGGTLLGNIALLGNSNSTTSGQTRLALGTRGNDGSSTTLVEILTIQSLGATVGIGTTGPTARLEVQGLANNNTVAAYGSTTSGQSYGIYVQAGTTSADRSFGVYNASNNPYLVVRGDGNVGIATAGPGAKLHIHGTSNTDQLQVIGPTINGNSHYQWDGATYRNPGDHVPSVLIRADNSNTGLNSFRPALTLYNNVGSLDATVGIVFAAREETAAGNAVNLSGIIGTKESSGTNNAWSSGGLQFFTKNTATRVDAMRILSTGFVGVGTTNPSTLMQIGSTVGTSNTYLTIETAAAYEAAIQFRSGGATRWLVYRPSNSNDLRIWDGGVGRDTMVFNTTTGNVGIGSTSTISARLQVSGSSTAATPTMIVREGVVSPTGGALAFEVENSAGAALFSVSGSGNVGVGTSNASGKFEVVGTSGSLMLVTDSLSGSLFSVNDVTGLPIFEVFSDDTVVAGAVNTNALVVTGSLVGIGTRTPGSALDVSSGKSIGTGGLRLGADVGLAARTNSTRKVGVISVPHFTNAQNDFALISGDANTSTNTIYIGGAWSENAATEIRFYTAANSTTTTGTTRAIIDSSGHLLPGANNTYDLGAAGTRWRNIYGNVYPGSSAFTAGSVVFAGASGVLAEDNAQFFWDDTNNSLGIGTSSPGTYGKFQIVGTNPVVSFAHDTGSSVFGGVLRFVPTNGANYIQSGINYTNNSAAPLIFTTINGVTEWMRIDGSGNVGIGTASSIAAKLHVFGGSLQVDNGTNNRFIALSDGNIELSRSGGNAYIDLKSTSGADYDTRIQSAGEGSQAALTFHTNGAEKMRIAPSGSATVGIGTNNPLNTLGYGWLTLNGTAGSVLTHQVNGSEQFRIQVDGATYLNTIAAQPMVFMTSGAEVMRISSGGAAANVGIGTDNPAVKLHVRVTAPYDGIYQEGYSPTTTRWIRIFPSGSAGAFTPLVQQSDSAIIYGTNTGADSASPGLVIGAWSNSRKGMRLDNNGNVGIGTETMSKKLVVHDSDALINGLTVGRGGVASNVGVSNTALGNGAGFSLNVGYSNNTALGASALYTNAIGERNTAVGNSALLNYNPASLSGDSTAVGYSSLYNSSTGISNTAVGSYSLYSATTAQQNVAIGRDAMYNGNQMDYSVAVGVESMRRFGGSDYNVAIGYRSSYSIDKASYTTAVGALALYNMRDLDHATAVGYGSLYANTGSYNTAVGGLSLLNNTSAAGNTAVGYASGIANTTASGSVYFGYYAGSSNQTGDRNTAVGYESLYSTTGADNLGLGYQSGRGITSGISNVAIGYRANYSGAGGASNVSIGYESLLSCTVSSNTTVGTYAGRNFTTGGSNTAIGAQAGQGAIGSTAQYNTFIGAGAGIAVSSGGYNTFLGNGSGGEVTTGIYNVILGSYDGNNSSLDMRTGNRNVVLSDGEGNIRARFDYTGAVGIGTASPVPNFTVTVTSGSTANAIDLDSRMYLLSTGLEKETGYYMSALTRSAHFRVSMATTGVRLGSSTSDPLYLQTNNTTALVIDTSQRVGINTTNPTTQLDVVGGASSYATLRLRSSAGSGYAYAQFGDSSTTTQNWHIGSEGTNVFYLWNGNWGSGSDKFRINNKGETWIRNDPAYTYTHFGYGAAGDNYITLGDNGAGTIGNTIFRYGYNGGEYELMRVTSTALGAPRVGIGTATASGNLHVWSSLYYGGNATGRPVAGTGTALVVVTTSGLVREQTSSRRFKKDIKGYKHGLDKILLLNPVSYTYKDEEVPCAGFLAEDLDEAGFVEFVLKDGENLPYSIRYDTMVALMTNGIKQLKSENDSLKSEVQSLKDQISSILMMLSNK